MFKNLKKIVNSIVKKLPVVGKKIQEKEKMNENEYKRLKKYAGNITKDEFKQLQKDALKVNKKQKKLRDKGYLIGGIISKKTVGIRSEKEYLSYVERVKKGLDMSYKENTIREGLDMFLDNLAYYVEGNMDEEEKALYEEVKRIFNTNNFNKLKKIMDKSNTDVNRLGRMIQILYYESDQEVMETTMGLRGFSSGAVLNEVLRILK